MSFDVGVSPKQQTNKQTKQNKAKQKTNKKNTKKTKNKQKTNKNPF